MACRATWTRPSRGRTARPTSSAGPSTGDSPKRKWTKATPSRSDQVSTEFPHSLMQRLFGAETEKSTSSRLDYFLAIVVQCNAIMLLLLFFYIVLVYELAIVVAVLIPVHVLVLVLLLLLLLFSFSLFYMRQLLLLLFMFFFSCLFTIAPIVGLLVKMLFCCCYSYLILSFYLLLFWFLSIFCPCFSYVTFFFCEL